jgi:hypothetical protein
MVVVLVLVVLVVLVVLGVTNRDTSGTLNCNPIFRLMCLLSSIQARYIQPYLKKNNKKTPMPEIVSYQHQKRFGECTL